MLPILVPVDFLNKLDRIITEIIALIGLFRINHIGNKNIRLLDLVLTDSRETRNIYTCEDCLLPLVQNQFPFIYDIYLDS